MPNVKSVTEVKASSQDDRRVDRFIVSADTMPPVLEILFLALALSFLSTMTSSLFSLAALSSVI